MAPNSDRRRSYGPAGVLRDNLPPADECRQATTNCSAPIACRRFRNWSRFAMDPIEERDELAMIALGDEWNQHS